MAYGIGNTVENSNVRVHRYCSAIRVTELVGAGKRGKRCREYCVYDLDRGRIGPGPLNMLDDAAAKVDTDAAATFDSVVAGLKAVDTFLLAHGCDTVPKQERLLRGVDVAPAGVKRIHIRGAHVEVNVQNNGQGDTFYVEDLDDPNNRPTIIQRKRVATSAAKVRAFFTGEAGRKLAETGTFSQVWKALEGLGVDLHYFCAMD